METIQVLGGHPGLLALVSRAQSLDAGASVRFRELGSGFVDAFVTTPFGVIASRRFEGHISRDGAVVSARDLFAALQEDEREIGPASDPNWPGALPPAAGFTLVDTLPVAVVRSLADEGQRLARQFSGPLGPPASLLDQTVITVTAPEDESLTVEIPMRMVFTCTSLGLIPGFEAATTVPRHLKVSRAGRWTRIDAPYGTVYRSTGLGGVLAL
ncbi:hypothetical protein [Corynebacterium tapiri]|uniref:Uncharacterized protein n=1 Tax=Corynebacterium tapiri TaxID=1448266 RepID=A0A5C4U1E7_9CORY|nr:hypothetical protein [Corynebacterium tapiri]TNL94873.1 hypothetical protein FHE74_10010 [Corynebacterium tapiri]